MGALSLSLGIIIVSLVLIQLGLQTVCALRQLVHQWKCQQLSLELLKSRIDLTAKQREENTLGWSGFRKFVIDRKAKEADGVCSFYLVPHDQKPLPLHQPGQYVTFRLNIPGKDKPVIRCYSLSNGPNSKCYRVSIKRVPAPTDQPTVPPGLVSNFIHEQLKEGDILDLQAARGQFFMDPAAERPAVLIAGGVGVTPLLSMAACIAEAGSSREIFFFYGVQNGGKHAFKTELENIAKRFENFHLVVCYSHPTPQDLEGEGEGYHHHGRISIELLKNYITSTNYEFYICGPPRLMADVTSQLAKWGVAKKDTFTEAFGAATVTKTASRPALKSVPEKNRNGQKSEADSMTEDCKVTFARSNKKCDWKSTSTCLLDLAMENGIAIESGCRAGNCGTCIVAVKSGNVSYLAEHGAEVDDGSCLTCIATPNGNITLDA